MNIDEPSDKQMIDEDFHGELDKNLFYNLLADDILDTDIHQNNANMEGGRQGAGQLDPQRMVIVDLMRNLQNFLVRKLNHQTIILIHLVITLKYKNQCLDTSVAQIITMFGYSLFDKPESSLTRIEKVDHMPLLQTGMPRGNTSNGILTQ